MPIATIMRRLLTGYAINHNRRHGHSGHLFQNRYKSILCQEDIYLKELIRYIHLNPLRVKLVKDMAALDRYQFAGHSYIIGKHKNHWQSITEVLSFFGNKTASAEQQYRRFIIKGVKLGRQPILVGGGLIRSAGGWSDVRSLRKAGIFQKSDERILGNGDFVQTVLCDAQEAVNHRYLLAAKGVSFEDVLKAVSNLLFIPPSEMIGPGKARAIVKARILVCYWGVRELGMSMSEISDRLKISVPTMSVAVKKGGQIVRNESLVLSEILNIKI